MAGTTTTEDLRRLLTRLDANCIRHFQGATNLCASRTHFEILPDHLLFRLLDETTGDLAQIFDTFKVERSEIRRALQKIFDALPSGHRGKPALSPRLIELFQSAVVMADEFSVPQVRTGHLVLAFVLNPGHSQVGELTPELDRIDVDQLRDHFQEIVLGSAEAATQTGAVAGAGTSAPSTDAGALEQYTIDLTAKAGMGDIDPVFGRDHEIRQMIDIFARRRKNNPILVGEPGTGKTAIVEGLALRIANADVPPMLQDVRIIVLDLGLLQAGAGVKGEFENRLKNVIKAIKASDQPIITFIDEAHMLIGAGAAAGGSDAANLLKPALARGELRTVAATTWAEYKKYFEKDAALERRFQLVRCDEPSIENTVVMLRGLKQKYEKHHKVIVLDEAILAAAELSSRYISGRFLPDKAVDLLDTTAGRVALSLESRPPALEDLERQLGHLSTTVTAIQRDAAGGMPVREDELKEIRTTQETIQRRQKEVEKRWQAELAAVKELRKLRGQLRAYTSDDDDGSGSLERAGAGDGDQLVEKDVGKESSPDEAEVRGKISDALSVLDELQDDQPMVYAHVDASAVAAIVADWTGIPVQKMVRDEATAILQMEEQLRSRVVGQDHALGTVAEKLRTSKAGLGNPDQPLGVFLCVGPSGVGKTELALSIADLLFGGDRFLTTINMSEFMEKHTVSQLKGSPPGYIGYGEGGVLTEAVRHHPYSVVLLDEVEKAHPDVLNLFYQVFDKGSLADGEGRVINFRNTVIFLTSNLATDVIQGMCESEEEVDPDALKEAIHPHLREHFKPALVARMTVIPFFTLGSEVLRSIAKMKLEKIAKRLTTAHGMSLNVEDQVYEQIADRCKEVDLGARQIDHLLDRVVLPDISRRLLERMGDEPMPSKMIMGTDEQGDFTFTFAS